MLLSIYLLQVSSSKQDDFIKQAELENNVTEVEALKASAVSAVNQLICPKTKL